LYKRQFSVSFITNLGSKVGLHFRRPARMGSSTLVAYDFRELQKVRSINNKI
jgi:hypothetical protein